MKKQTWSNDKSIDELKKIRLDLHRLFIFAYFTFVVFILISIIMVGYFPKVSIGILLLACTLSITFLIISVGFMIKWECRTIIITIKEQKETKP